MKVCLDTNVLVSGIFWKGLPAKIVALWMNEAFDLLITDSIFDEYQKIIRKIGSKINPFRAETWVRLLGEQAVVIPEMEMQRHWSRDPDDDKFIYCSLAGDVDFLVSGDRDLLELRGKLPLKIVSVKQFCDLNFF